MDTYRNALLTFINFLYSKGKTNYRRAWNSESLRIALKKKFLDRLSCIVARHRVLDYTYFGASNRKRNNAFQQPSNVVNNVRSYRELIFRF